MAEQKTRGWQFFSCGTCGSGKWDSSDPLISHGSVDAAGRWPAIVWLEREGREDSDNAFIPFIKSNNRSTAVFWKSHVWGSWAETLHLSGGFTATAAVMVKPCMTKMEPQLTAVFPWSLLRRCISNNLAMWYVSRYVGTGLIYYDTIGTAIYWDLFSLSSNETVNENVLLINHQLTDLLDVFLNHTIKIHKACRRQSINQT